VRIISHLPKERWVEYRDLRIQALLDVPHAFLDEPEQAKKLEPGEWQRKMKNMIFAEDDGKLIGMIGAYREDKEKLKHIVNIVSFYVVPQFRGKGAGKALLQEVITNYTNDNTTKKLQLGVTTTQNPAQHLYRSLGFTQVGKLQYAVKVGNTYFDEYLMEYYFN